VAAKGEVVREACGMRPDAFAFHAHLRARGIGSDRRKRGMLGVLPGGTKADTQLGRVIRVEHVVRARISEME